MFSATVRCGKERRLLVDRRDAQRAARMGSMCGTARRRPSACRVGPLGAGDDLDERRLAGAVLADERVDFAGAEVERHAFERAHAREGLADRSRVEKKAGHVFRDGAEAGTWMLPHVERDDWPHAPRAIAVSERRNRETNAAL